MKHMTWLTVLQGLGVLCVADVFNRCMAFWLGESYLRWFNVCVVDMPIGVVVAEMLLGLISFSAAHLVAARWEKCIRNDQRLEDAEGFRLWGMH